MVHRLTAPSLFVSSNNDLPLWFALLIVFLENWFVWLWGIDE